MSDDPDVLVTSKQSDSLLGYCPGYTPSKEFLETATQYLKSVIQYRRLEYSEALDDVVRSIYLYKLNRYKKDHRVFLYKSKHREPLSSNEIKLRDDIRRYLLRAKSETRPPKKSRSIDSEESCPTHKKDCNTSLYKIRGKCKKLQNCVSCLWYQRHEKTIVKNKAAYMGYDGKNKVRFEHDNDDDDVMTAYDRDSLLAGNLKEQQNLNQRCVASGVSSLSRCTTAA